MDREVFMRAIVITSAAVLVCTCGMAASFQASAGYAILGSSYIPGDAQIIALGMTPTTFDNGLLTVTQTVTPDSNDPNSQWINFEIQPTNGTFAMLGTSGLFEIPLSILPLDTSGTFSGFEASFTGGAGSSTPAITFAGNTSLTSVAVLLDVAPYSGPGTGTSSFTIGVRETFSGSAHDPPPPGSDPPPPTGGSDAPEPATAGLAGLALLVIGAGARRWKLSGN